MNNQIYRERTARNESAIPLQGKDCTVYHEKTDTGELMVTGYDVLPGISLVYTDAHIQKYRYPAVHPFPLLEITYCCQGRFEYDAGEQFFYLGKGDLAIYERTGNWVDINCPTRHYHGVSVVIDPAAAPRSLSYILEDVNVEPSALVTKFCQGQQNYIIRSTPRLEHIFSELYSVPEHMKRDISRSRFWSCCCFSPGLSRISPRRRSTPSQEHR